MNVSTTWRKLENGTQIYLFAPGVTTRHDGILRDGVVCNDLNDDYCVAFGASITVDGQRISLTANMMIFDSRDERDAIASEHSAVAADARAAYNAPAARAARDAKLVARDNAREDASIRREMLSQ